MYGADVGSTELQGIIPRAIDRVTAHAASALSNDTVFSLHLSALEVHNENVYDLLAEADASSFPVSGLSCVPMVNGKARRTSLSSRRSLSLKVDKYCRTIVQGLKPTPFTTAAQGHALVNKALLARQTAATALNLNSSRSHLVITIHINSNKAERASKLHLVDLAGSECVAKSKVVGDRLTETLKINRSLSALSDVFGAIRDKEVHVPFRRSKLTRLLEESLCGTGRPLLIVNVSPLPECVSETTASLRFGNLVSHCTPVSSPSARSRSVVSKCMRNEQS